MDSIVLKENELKRLKEYPLDKIINVESVIYYYKKDCINNASLLLKKLYLTDEKRVSRKIETVETLQKSELSEYKELVIPQDVVSIKGIKSGFTIKEVIDCINFQLILDDYKIPTHKKIEVLKKVGSLLERVQSSKQEFYFGDLHASNILVDSDGEISIVDLDSSAISRKKPIESKYIAIDKKTHNIPKYKINKAKRMYPSIDSDIYYYNTMVLNVIAGRPINRISIPEYYDYLNFLDDKGISLNILDILSNHYSNKSNESLCPYLDELPNQIGKEQFKVYKLLKK